MPDATTPECPSHALATLAAAMTSTTVWDRAVFRRELDQIGDDPVPPEEWRIPGSKLCAEVAGAIGGWPPSAPTSARTFAQYAIQLQRLDRWHRPLLPTEVALPRLSEHGPLLTRMALEHRFNDNAALGSIIPRLSVGDAFLRLDRADLDWSNALSLYAVTNGLLDICVFLPAVLPACDPDTGGVPATRTVSLSYKRFPANRLALGGLHDRLRIAIAPLAETDTDARIWVEGDRYSIHPSVPFARLEEVIDQAIVGEADLLLTPEMTVDEEDLALLTEAIRRLWQKAALSSPPRLPRLRMLLVGVIARPKSHAGRHRNYIVAIDAKGEIIFTQDKLSHWNLDEKTQERFGLSGKGFPILLHEDTEPADELVVAEFDGFGRIMALICADMSRDMPGDWITDYLGLDWLYAPIMDGSTCWTQYSTPWIIERSIRACKRADTAVIVTNSMVMTHWNNSVIDNNMRINPGYRYRRYARCGVGLIVRPGLSGTEMQHVTVDLADFDSPVIRMVDWSSTWDSIPSARSIK